MLCEICSNKKEANYKCPKCKISYCSVSCWNSHQRVGCQSVEKSKVRSPVNSYTYDFPTENTVPLEKLKLLDHNTELKNILCNRHLRDMLVAIDKSTNPAAAMQQAMLEPIFVEFADECLKVVEPSED